MKYGLSKKQLREIVDALKSHREIQKAVIFGSRVTDDYKAASDVDIAIFGAETNADIALKVKYELEEETYLPFFFDVVAYNAIASEELKERVKNEGEVIFDSATSGWKETRIGLLATKIGSGVTPRGGSNSYKNEGIALIRVQNVLDLKFSDEGLAFIDEVQAKDLENVVVEKDDVLLNITGSVARVCKIPERILPARVNQHVAIIRADTTKLDSDFLLYNLIYQKAELLNLSEVGATRNAITKGMIEQFTIALPPLAEQKAIADVLSSFDDKIELLNRQNETLEATAQALFRRRFIDNARADWQAAELKDIYAFEKGCEPGSDNYLQNKTANSVRFIRVGDMLARQAALFVDKALCDAVCDETDVLVSFDGTVGRVVFGVQGCYSSGIRKIYARDEAFNNMGFKFLLFKSDSIQREIQENAIGTVILHASSSIEHLTFAYKDKEQIARFNRAIEPMFERMLSNLRQIGALERLRDALLPKLMSGSVRIA